MTSQAHDSLITTNAIMNTSDECWRLHLRGADVRSIAQTVEESIEQIVERLERMMQQPPREVPSPRAHVEKLVDEVHLVRQAAWAGWERSAKDKIKTTHKEIKGGPGGGRTEETTVTEQQAGDASFLRIIADCNRREALLRGVEKGVRQSSGQETPAMDLDTLIEQMEAAMATEIDQAGGRPAAPQRRNSSHDDLAGE